MCGSFLSSHILHTDYFLILFSFVAVRSGATDCVVE
jgi:hypothetical protein